MASSQKTSGDFLSSKKSSINQHQQGQASIQNGVKSASSRKTKGKMKGAEKKMHSNDIEIDGPLAASGESSKTAKHTSAMDSASFMPLLVNILKDKNYNELDFYILLCTHKDTCYRLPTELVFEGLPLLHLCIIHKRFSFLSIPFHLGWQSMLFKLKAGKDSDHEGLTVTDLAEKLNLKKAKSDLSDIVAWDESLSIVMKAARRADISHLETLVKTEGENLYYRDANNANALYWAVVNGSLQVVQIILHDAGMDSSMKTFKGETLLHVAAAFGHADLISILVIECKIDPDAKDSAKKTCLDKVAENGDIETFTAFRECGVHPQPDFGPIAAFNGRLRLIQHCIERRIFNIDTKDIYDRTPLLRAIEAGHFELVKYLLSKGADIFAAATTNKNVLHYAAESGNMDVLNILVNKLESIGKLRDLINEKDRHNGVANIFIIRGRDKGKDAYHYCEVTRYLVPIFLRKSRSGTIDVAKFGKVVKSGWGANPGPEAVEYIEELCKKRRLDLNRPADQTPLPLALFKGNVEAAELLITKGANVSIRDHFGSTPLMTAASKNLISCVKLLEQKGASLMDINNDGLSILEIAERNESEEVINYLRGKDYLANVQHFLDADLGRLKRELSAATLDRLRRNGTDVRRHIIDTLRDFRIDVNQTLLQIGSGPILEESH